ncbi:sarcosine oxidase subunit gamma [Neorhizobium lilium]|uniref:Sarcosine oxidase subunit gamma n=1 Tax=Neorhizobium lilium TaxID=2503024 RepID=A0A3S3S7N9_9HYPH|nr:sarcosine oxidase subunit gamma family protein [Neorhizobium lilium]RWX78907.1 sarcosine oxidase subunit gamma [Neorhizobium lilium]
MTLHFLHRHVLEDHLAGFETRPNPNHVNVARRPVILSVLAHSGHEAAVAERLAELAGGSVRFCGPGEWLVAGPALLGEELADRLGEIPGASVCDQSDGKVLMAIGGPSARKILAKCVAADLHGDVFAEGQSANMLCCHVASNLARTGADLFEIIVPRSFAGSVFEELMEMGREYALTASFSED